MPSLDSVAAACFWLSAAGIAYAYAGYPLVVWTAARLFGRTRRCPDEGASPPFISVLIAAHNEEDIITRRLQNAAALDYPSDRFEVVIASDGSTDATPSLVAEFNDPRVKLIEFRVRRGKADVLNQVIPELRGDIVVFSDANAFIEPGVLRRVARWFQDDRVGVVCGRLVLSDPVSGNNVDSIYWKYETFLKICEARLDALLGANGAIYAIRRKLFAPLRAGTLVDDTGSSIVYDTQSVAHEDTPAELASEFERRRRIGAGDFQSIPILYRLLAPSQGWIAFTFLSHKILRWLCPFLLVTMFVSNLLLVTDPWYALALAGQIGAYGAAAAGLAARGPSSAARLLRLITLFMTMNLALLVGFWKWAWCPPVGIWPRTARSNGITMSK